MYKIAILYAVLLLAGCDPVIHEYEQLDRFTVRIEDCYDGTQEKEYAISTRYFRYESGKLEKEQFETYIGNLTECK